MKQGKYFADIQNNSQTASKMLVASLCSVHLNYSTNAGFTSDFNRMSCIANGGACVAGRFVDVSANSELRRMNTSNSLRLLGNTSTSHRLHAVGMTALFVRALNHRWNTGERS